MPHSSKKPASGRSLPPYWPPLLYLGLAYGSLALAFGAMLGDPRSVSGFYYNPRMLAVVHLVTLGWITCSILGMLYLIAPMTLRTYLPARTVDRWAFASVAIGVSGMASHFWIDEPLGMALAAPLVWIGVLAIGSRFLRELAKSATPSEIKLHYWLAFGNFALAGLTGVLIGFDKISDVIPGYRLAHVAAHAHLATVGWATMIFIASAYRLLPMMLPAAPPVGTWVRLGAVTLETGVLGLFVALLFDTRWILLPALVTAAGLVIFLSRVVWMLRHPKPAPGNRLKPDPGVAHAVQALVYLAASVVLGVYISVVPPSEGRLAAILAYGAVGLLGFLGQAIVGVSSRVLPWFAWLKAHATSDYEEVPPPLKRIPVVPVLWLGMALWTLGVPVLVIGLVQDAPDVIRLGSGLLLGGLVASAVNSGRAVAVAFRSRNTPVPGGTESR